MCEPLDAGPVMHEQENDGVAVIVLRWACHFMQLSEGPASLMQERDRKLAQEAAQHSQRASVALAPGTRRILAQHSRSPSHRVSLARLSSTSLALLHSIFITIITALLFSASDRGVVSFSNMYQEQRHDSKVCLTCECCQPAAGSFTAWHERFCTAIFLSSSLGKQESAS